MNILITGAQFGNKGAQSLLFSTTNEIRSKYADARLFYLPCDNISNYDVSNINLKFVYDDQSKFDCDDIIRRIQRNYKRMLIEKKIKKRIDNREIVKLSSLWDEIDLLIDISGYNLSSKFSVEINNRYLRYISEAQKHNIATILMPQSFGPFSYKNSKIDDKILKILPKVDVICAREQEGVEELKTKYSICDNVYHYPDLVLTSNEIDYKNIYNFDYISTFPRLSTDNNVGIIPNEQLISLGDENKILNLYDELITLLIGMNKNVYIFRHSDDLNFCKKIYNRCNNKNVILLENDFNCEEYALFVKQFDYIIASRFHSVVHAYKAGVPALILGWSIKYNNLARIFNQDKYVVDVTSPSFNKNEVVLEKLVIINDDFKQESEVIKKSLTKVRKNSCFEQLWKLMDSIQTEGYDNDK